MSRDYYSPTAPFLYTTQDSGSGGSGASGDHQLGPGSTGMDCLHGLRCGPSTSTPGPFHYLINEQAKSLVALQELQHEVGALLEFRDLVIETFPNLRNKMASTATATSNPVTMTGSSSQTNLPLRRDWEPGIRVRRRIQNKDSDNSPSRSRSNSQSNKNQTKSSSEAIHSVIQDSGFSTETSSSKETHSASSTSGMQATGKDSSSSPQEAEDELWNLLDVIQRKGTKLRDEVDALQGAICNRADLATTDFHQQILLGNTPQDVINLRRERDILLEKLADMESENLAGRVQASRLRADLESLLATKIDLEEQLRSALVQKTELNSRIHGLHEQFVKSASNSPESVLLSANKIEKPIRKRRTLSNRSGYAGANSPIISSNSNKELLVTNFPHVVASQSTSILSANQQQPRLLDVLGHSDNQLPKVRVPDPKKIAAIVHENDPLVLKQSLLTVTVHNQALKEKLDVMDKLKNGLIENLTKAREQNEDLKFQLEEKSIELEGTRARVRVLEHYQFQKNPSQDEEDSNELLIPSSAVAANRGRSGVDQLITPSMKAMIPIQLADEITGQNNTSSTESAHNEHKTPHESVTTVTVSRQRKPSRIPLPGTNSSPSSRTTIKSISSPLPRPGSAQSANSLKNSISMRPKTPRDSLSNRIRSNDSLSRLQTNQPVVPSPGRSTSICNKRDGLTRVRRAGGNGGNIRGATTTSTQLSSSENDTNTKVRPAKLPFWSNWLKILDNNGPS